MIDNVSIRGPERKNTTVYLKKPEKSSYTPAVVSIAVLCVVIILLLILYLLRDEIKWWWKKQFGAFDDKGW